MENQADFFHVYFAEGKNWLVVTVLPPNFHFRVQFHAKTDLFENCVTVIEILRSSYRII